MRCGPRPCGCPRPPRRPEGSRPGWRPESDRKSTRLNSSHGYISYAVFCLKKKTNTPSFLLSATQVAFLLGDSHHSLAELHPHAEYTTQQYHVVLCGNVNIVHESALAHSRSAGAAACWMSCAEHM